MSGSKCLRTVLMEYGFSEWTARTMAVEGSIRLPLSENVKLNIELLGELYNISSIDQELAEHIAAFLNREHETNLMLIDVPERYDIRGGLRKDYYEHLLMCDVDYDLKAALDGKLCMLIDSEAERMNIYRQMYMYGVWKSAKDIIAVCKVLKSAAPDQVTLRNFMLDWWWRMFSYYCDPVAFITDLRMNFKRNRVWDIFCSNLSIVEAYNYHSVYGKSIALNEIMRLKQRYSDALK